MGAHDSCDDADTRLAARDPMTRSPRLPGVRNDGATARGWPVPAFRCALPTVAPGDDTGPRGS